jgi:hypothetical protein
METLDPSKCRKESFAVARSYQRVCESDFDDGIYAKHVHLCRASFLTKKAISEIEHYTTVTPKGDFREIDVHKFDVK